MTFILLIVAITGVWLEQAAGLKISPYEGLSLSNLCIYVMLVMVVIKARDIKYRPGRLELVLFLFVLWYFCSIPIKLISTDFQKAEFLPELVSFKGWVSPFIFFCLFSLLITNTHTAISVIKTLTTFTFISAITSLLASKGVSFLARAGITSEGRTYGFAEPNQFAAYLVLMAPYFIVTMHKGSTPTRRILSGVSLVVIISALVASGSRGGLIAFGLTILVYLALSVWYKVVKPTSAIFVASALAIILFAGIVFAPTNVRDITLKKFHAEKSANLSDFTSGRTMLLEKGLILFAEKPIWGYGQDTFLPLMIKHFRIRGVSHNEYLGYAIEQGALGLALLLFLYGSIIFNTFKWLRETDTIEAKALYLSFCSGFIGLCIALFGVNLYGPRTFVWIYVAAIFAYHRLTVLTEGNNIIKSVS
jgi:O-antigen ligase